MDLKTLAILVPVLPLAGAALVGAVGLRWLRDRSHWLVLAGVFLALVAAVCIYADVRVQADRADDAGMAKLAEPISVCQWISAGGGSWLNVTFRVDQLTCVMLLTVLAVSLIIVAYSVGYMRDHHGQAERGYERFFAYLGLFVFSMCTLVLAGNFLLLYLGWELVGLCSYLLIGFYYQRPAAAAAAKKAFLVNRVGDFGFGLGVLLIYLTFGTLDYRAVFDAVSAVMRHDGAGLHAALGLAAGADVTQLAETIRGRITPIALLLFCGAVGKSAQLPLHVWLPDAMEGPTPVSALIHAATMVTAGVYMVARCCVVFAASPVAMTVVACIGAATALFAATIALTQFDMKRILAYSTISQLGYMFLGLGVGAFGSAIFHLHTHAFFKALLFLGAGSVMHAMGGVIDIRRFGGLGRGMKITAATFWVGGLALAGFPLLSGFWSKDEIVHAALASSMPWLGVIGLLTALLTAFYTFRMIFIAFHGPVHLPRGVEHVRESGRWMTVPLVLLAVGAALAGYTGVTGHLGGFAGLFEPHGGFHEFIRPVFAGVSTEAGGADERPAVVGRRGVADGAHAAGAAMAARGASGAARGAEGVAHGTARVAHGAGGAAYSVAEAAHAETSGGHLARYWLMYGSSIIAVLGMATAAFFYLRRPAIPVAIALWAGPGHRLLYDKYYVDELYEFVFVRPARRLGEFCHGVDRFVINGLLWLIAAVPRAIGFGLKGWQHGAMQGYALAMVVGLLIIMLWVLVRSAA